MLVIRVDKNEVEIRLDPTSDLEEMIKDTLIIIRGIYINVKEDNEVDGEIFKTIIKTAVEIEKLGLWTPGDYIVKRKEVQRNDEPQI